MGDWERVLLQREGEAGRSQGEIKAREERKGRVVWGEKQVRKQVSSRGLRLLLLCLLSERDACPDACPDA